MLGEHRELHAIWSIRINNKKGYVYHPETVRWKGKRKAVYLRDEELVGEILRRGYRHHSPLEVSFATGCDKQDVFIDSIKEQVLLLRQKKCRCTI